MRKFLILSLALLMLSIELWAQESAEQNTLPTPASNQIVYRSSDHQKIGLNSACCFDATYNDAQSTYNTKEDYGVITFDGDITTIGDWAFSSKKTLTAVVWPSSVTSIGILAFNGCTKLSTINLQEGITNIGNDAFSGCTGIAELIIPSTMTSIGNYAFNGCTNVTSVTFLGYVLLKGNPFKSVGTVENPVNLNLPSTWLASDKPVDGTTPWYGGYFNCTSTPTALPTLPYEGKDGIGSSKLIKNGRLIIRKGEKTYNAHGF